MDRKECERLICEKVKEIWEIYEQYNPTGYDLSLHVTKKGLVQVNNVYWQDDKDKPLTTNMNWRDEENG